MDLRNLTLFDMTKTKMDWLAQRQKILAQNIANADTPQYKAHDLKELDFSEEIDKIMSPRVEVARTNAAHQTGTLPERGPFRENTPDTFEESIDGNRVILEEQMQKVGTTKSEYNLAINLFKKNVSMLKTALGKQS